MSDLRQADRELAKASWTAVWRGSAPLWAGLAMAIVFFGRSLVCSYEEPIPEGLDFEWYGNHCGPGHGDPDDPAIDELDEACKRHDAAYRAAEVSGSE